MNKTKYDKQYYLDHREEFLARASVSYASPEGKRRNLANRLRREFDMTLEEYERKDTEQAGLCKICGHSQHGGKRLAVDHDHDTKENRDLLCDLCNRALGLFKDNLDTLRNAVAYLEKWKK
jgi:hypothetical protein